MTETSGRSKLKTALKHLENTEILLGGLPKKLIENGKKKQVREIEDLLITIQEKIKDIFKDELE